MRATNHNDTAKLWVVTVWVLSYLVGFFFLRNSGPVNIFIMVWIVTALGLLFFIFCQRDTNGQI